MQNFFKKAGVATALTLAILALQGCEATKPTVKPVNWTYDFDFAIEGDLIARPTQVFTDGKNTYLSFRPTQPIGLIKSKDGEILDTREQGHTRIVSGVQPELFITLGNQYSSRVTYRQMQASPATSR
jgi:hypothetical protein